MDSMILELSEVIKKHPKGTLSVNFDADYWLIGVCCEDRTLIRSYSAEELQSLTFGVMCNRIDNMFCEVGA